MRKLISVLSALLVASMIFCACGNNNGKNNNELSSDESLEQNVIELIADGKANYGLVRAVSMNDEAVEACGALYNKISKITKVSLQFVPDDSTLEDGIKEILIGNTTREESSEVAETLNDGEYAIKVVGDKIVIISNEDDTLVDAINAFAEQCLKGASAGKWVVDEDLSIEGVNELFVQKLQGRYIPEGAELVAESTPLPLSLSNYAVTGITGSSVSVQGSCIAKGYLYTFLLLTATEDQHWVVKMNINDRSDWTAKKLCSDEPEKAKERFGHVGDAAYIASEDVILVTGGTQNFELIDPDTLEELGSISTERQYNFIGYDKFSNRLYLDRAGKFAYCYDVETKRLDLTAMKTEISDGYKWQGVTCDGTYYYAIEGAMDNKSNNLIVYDLKTGELVHRIDLGIGYEAEDIDYYDGAFYVACNNSQWTGSVVFKVDIKVK